MSAPERALRREVTLRGATSVPMRTAAWYGDRTFTLELPPSWDVTTHWPETPPALTDAQIADAVERPSGQPPIRERARGRRRPVIVVDDLNRPTPVPRVMPIVLRQLEAAGIAARDVTIVVASGTHAPPSMDALRTKVGPEAAAVCRLHAHDARSGHVVSLGRTSFGTPILVDGEVARADLVVGIGGVYPNHTAGFGGGTKLALGVLAYRAIANLHFRHAEVGWGKDNVTSSSFRRDLDEIAVAIGLDTSVLVHLDAEREPVRVACGAPGAIFADALAFSRRVYEAPLPDGADVVIANAYPNDLSLTFVRAKGLAALDHAPTTASRVAIAALSEGVGFHGLFPFVGAPRFHRARGLVTRLTMLGHQPGELVGKVARGVMRRVRSRRAGSAAPARHPVWVYRPVDGGPALPPRLPTFRVASSWTGVVEAVTREQGGRQNLRAVVYPCGPLQWLQPPPAA